MALVNRHGEVLLRMRDEQSAIRANRWSLVGGSVTATETPQQAAARLIAEQTGLTAAHELRLAWQGNLPGLPAEAYLLAAATAATTSDIAVDRIPGAMGRRGMYVLEFVPGHDVQSGRPFTEASGYVIGPFLDSRLYRELAAHFDADEVA